MSLQKTGFRGKWDTLSQGKSEPGCGGTQELLGAEQPVPHTEEAHDSSLGWIKAPSDSDQNGWEVAQKPEVIWGPSNPDH